MNYTPKEVKEILMRYTTVTEPELKFRLGETVYELCICASPKTCSLSACNQRFEVMYVSFDELFDREKVFLGLCLTRDWDYLELLRCVPDLAEPEKVIERYKKQKELYPDQVSWSKATLDYCAAYLKEKYGETWLKYTREDIDEDIAVQNQPYYELEDGSILCLSYSRGLHGIVVEIAENEETAKHFAFEDADIIYEGFDTLDSLKLLVECISWEGKNDYGQERI